MKTQLAQYGKENLLVVEAALGETIVLPMDWAETDGTPIDVTGLTFYGAIIVDGVDTFGTVAIEDAPNGAISVTFPRALTSTLTAGTYPFALSYDPGSGERIGLLEGSITLARRAGYE